MKKKSLYKSISKSKILNTISPRNIDQSYNKSKINCLKVKKKKRRRAGGKENHYKITRGKPPKNKSP